MPVTVPNEPPLIVTVFTPPLFVTVTVTVACDDTVLPSSKVAGTVVVTVCPSVTVFPPVTESNAQGVTVFVSPTLMVGIVDSVYVKMHEP